MSFHILVSVTADATSIKPSYLPHYRLFTMDSIGDSRQTRIDNAKAFLREHPDEKVACAAKVFGLAHSTLFSSTAKNNQPVSTVINGGQNKILEPRQAKAIMD